MIEEALMGAGKKSAKIMFVADFPTFTEYKRGKWFSDKGGNLLRDVLEEIGIDPEEDCYFTGVVKEPTPKDDRGLQRDPLKDEIEAYADVLDAEIAVIEPEIIVPMGNVALKRIFGSTGITRHRGKATENEDHIIFPIIHPNHVFRQPRYTDNLIKDIQNLAKLADQGSELLRRSDVEYRYLETVKEIEAEIVRLLDKPDSEWLVFDIETTGLDPFKTNSKIVCISLTDKDHYGVTIPLAHRETTLTKEEQEYVVSLLKILLENDKAKKVAHNGKFDMKWLEVMHDIRVENFAFDPFLAHYVAVSEEQGGHGLKELAWEHTDMGGYDNELDEWIKNNLPKKDRGNYDNIPWDILRSYAAADVDCTFRLIDVFQPMIEGNPKWKVAYKELFIEGSYALMDMEINGVAAKPEKVAEFQKAYVDRIEDIERRLREYPEVVQIERDKKKLFELRQLEMKKPIPERDKEILKYNKFKNYKFNFGSPQQLRELLFDKLGLDTPFKTGTGAKSTGAETLEYLRDKHPLSSLLAEWRRVEKLYGTYIKPASEWIDSTDGRVHPIYNLAGTVTTRLSSENPNAQNFPRESNDPDSFEYQYGPKKLFSSRFEDEGVILQWDYSQLELRVAAIFSGDEQLINAYREGKDLHTYVASKVYKISEDEVTTDIRDASKAVNFGILYGKGSYSLAQDMGVEKEEAEDFLDTYFDEFKGIKRWIDRVHNDVRKKRYVETMTGLRRRLPSIDSNDRGIQADALRQSVNSPVQGSGANMTMKAVIMINRAFRSRGLKSVLMMTVHDSIVADVYIPELEEVHVIMQAIMENLPFSWITVPIVADAEIGRNYGTLVDYDDPSDFEEYGGVLNYIDVKVKEKEQKLRGK